MILMLVILLARYSDLGFEAIWATPSLRLGFLITALAVVMSACLATIWAFQARAVLFRSAYETLNAIAATQRIED